MCCAITADATRIISGSGDKTLRLWDATSGTTLRTLSGHTNWVRCCAITADATRIVSGSGDKTLRLWDATSGTALRTLSGHTNSVMCCAITADATRIVSASGDYTLRLWDATSGTTLRTLSGHSDTVYCCAITADATRIVSGSHDGTVRVWGKVGEISNLASAPSQTKHASQSDTILPVGSSVYAVAITPDGQRILSGSSDHTLRVWRIPSGPWTEADLRPEHTIDCGSTIYGISVAGHDSLKIVVALSNGTCLILEIEQGK